MKTIHAVFERGIFRPLQEVDLPERCEVEFEPRPVVATAGVEAIYAVLGERYASGERDVSAGHNEHQP